MDRVDLLWLTLLFLVSTQQSHRLIYTAKAEIQFQLCQPSSYVPSNQETTTSMFSTKNIV